MQTITLKDDRYKIIGYIQIDDKGNKTLKDDRYKILGYYQVNGDVTKDDRYRIVGHGDILTSLLRK